MCANTPAVLANSNGKQEDRFVLKFNPEPPESGDYSTRKTSASGRYFLK